jgi:acylphosphatase
VSIRAVDVVVTGSVQGVFFRASCAEQAQRLGITGWVANLPDGSVAGHFEGSPEAVDALVAWCHDGPRHAAVAAVSVDEVEAKDHRRFDVR